MRTFPRSLAQFRDIVRGRGEQLRGLSFGEIVELTESPTEHIAVASRSATISLIVEPQPDGSVRVVVQGFMKHRIMPGASVALDGFYKHPDGRVSAMLDRELYAYD